MHIAWVFFCVLTAPIFFKSKNYNIETTRELNIDGLRYILAAFVAFEHNSIVALFFKTGQWVGYMPVLMYSSQFGVAVFFMITGYLFGNLNKNTNWPSFFIKRFFRIAPIFYLSSVICMIIAAYIGTKTGDDTQFKSILYWLDSGVTGIKPGIFGYTYASAINAGVTWTLQWEWMFYFSMPIVSIFLNKKYSIFFIILFISGVALLPYSYGNVLVIFFAVGILVRKLKKSPSLFSKKIKDLIALLILTFCLFIFNNHSAFSLESCVFIGVFFYMIATGSDLFGMLAKRGVVILGDASYSIYLLHGIAWFVMNKIIFHYKLEDQTTIYYLIQTATWYLICFTCTKTYKYIETPCINYGKRIASNFHKSNRHT